MDKLIKKIKSWYRNYIYVPGYCKLCDSCGEEGCCSPISCMWKCMVEESPTKCQYGERYAKDLMFSYNMNKIYMKYIELLRNNKITKEQFIEKIDNEWDEMWDEIYSVKNKLNK